MPGGFGEVGYSPTENILLKEIEEETGLKLKVERLLAVFDTNRFQLQSKQYTSLFLDVKLLDGQFKKNRNCRPSIFAIDQLPSLI